MVHPRSNETPFTVANLDLVSIEAGPLSACGLPQLFKFWAGWWGIADRSVSAACLSCCDRRGQLNPQSYKAKEVILSFPSRLYQVMFEFIALFFDPIRIDIPSSVSKARPLSKPVVSPALSFLCGPTYSPCKSLGDSLYLTPCLYPDAALVAEIAPSAASKKAPRLLLDGLVMN